VLVTNSIIIGNTLKAVHDERIENINNIADAVAYDMSSSMENAAYVTVDLYASNSISSFLDEQYESDSAFVKAYNKVFENYVFYSSSKRMIDGITLYSDNPTMINGGRYYRINGIRSENWYKKYVESGQDLFVYTYYTDSDYFENKRRMISVIRKLNLFGRVDIEKIVKLDLNYNRITEFINNSAFDTTVYICHGNKIVFSNDKRDKGLKEDFEDISMIPMEKVQAHKSMSTYGFDYDIYLMGYKSDYATILKDRLWLIAFLFLADALLPAGIIALFSNSITTRVLLLRKYLRKVKGEVFEPIPDTEGQDEISELLDNYNLMAGRMNNLIEYEYKSKLEQQELHLARQQAELLALYSQINPHFMFNVLESIRMRSMIKGEHETSQMIESLARLMRKSAEWGADLITIEQELGFTEDYLNLQRYRFGNDFNFKYRINNKCYSYLIPSLVLVTFVENSCVHGLNKEGHSGTIYISIYEEDAYLFIEVEDTGIGMEKDKVQSLEKLLNEADINDLQKTTSLGMLNACIRLKKYCGNQVKISIESEIQVGTCVIIRIPIENVKNTYNERRAAENGD
jgi:two-component system sensor histidine kinase YesM